MNFEPTCAVCGLTVAPDSDHTEVTAERINLDDRNREDTYHFHNRCWQAIAGSWRTPV